MNSDFEMAAKWSHAQLVYKPRGFSVYSALGKSNCIAMFVLFIIIYISICGERQRCVWLTTQLKARPLPRFKQNNTPVLLTLIPQKVEYWSAYVLMSEIWLFEKHTTGWHARKSACQKPDIHSNQFEKTPPFLSPYVVCLGCWKGDFIDIIL